MEFILVSISMAIIAIPEGLPLSMTSALSFAISELRERGILLKNLEACEKLGRISNLLVNKTGTLTKNDI